MSDDSKDFELESNNTPGTVPTRVVDELRRLRTKQNDAATDFREAIKVQADKHKIKPAALRRYVVALGNDKLDELAAEAADLEGLCESSNAPKPEKRSRKKKDEAIAGASA